MKARIGRVACTVLFLVAGCVSSRTPDGLEHRRAASDAATAAFVPREALEPVRLTPDDLKWIATPSGVHVARLAGDDKAAGTYVIRYRFPANLKVQPHFHPDDRVVVVLSGTLHVGYGEQFDEGTLKALPAGSVWTEPAKQPHFVWAKEGEVMIQVVGNGPSTSTPVQSKQ